MDLIEINLAQACQAYFIFATSAAVIVNAIPALRKPFVHYGARREAQGPIQRESESRKGAFDSLLSLAGKLQVPHSWFTYYYVLSVLSSLFWAWQITTRGAVFIFLVRHTRWNRNGSMSINQVVMTCGFLFLHSCRRLYESVAFAKPSRAMVSIIPYTVAGVAFYIFIGVAVWVEGIRKSYILKSRIFQSRISFMI